MPGLFHFQPEHSVKEKPALLRAIPEYTSLISSLALLIFLLSSLMGPHPDRTG